MTKKVFRIFFAVIGAIGTLIALSQWATGNSFSNWFLVGVGMLVAWIIFG